MAVAVVAALLGYTQWRRQTMLREAAALESLGFTLRWQRGWTDSLWPQAPRETAFTYNQEPDGQIRTAAGVYSEHDLSLLYERACVRLHALGVEDVRLDRDGKPGRDYTSTHVARVAE
jgi:hypothetical protein